MICSWYRAEKPDTYTTGVGFCVTPQHRVAKIVWSAHG